MTMKVDLQCPMCDDGILTATCSPDSLDDLTDDGCGHAQQLWALDGADPTWVSLVESIWKTVEEEAVGRYEDAEEAKYQRTK